MENAKPARKPIPRGTQLEVFDRCRRRCALCFWISGDLEEKHGQIAHLDDDPSNNSEDNLAFFCLSHHSVYDSKTRQHKNYTLEEAKAARAALHSAIAEERHISQPSSPSRVKADLGTLSDLLETLPSKGVIQWIRDTDFAGAFDRAELEPISRFIHERSGPEHEFLDNEIENLRQKFRANCIRFKEELAAECFPLKLNLSYAQHLTARRASEGWWHLEPLRILR
jgi:hypothetical protein